MKRFVAAVAVSLALLGAAPRSEANGAISMDVRDLDVYDVARLLSTQSKLNVVVDQSVAHHPITLRLKHVTFDEAMRTLAQSNDLEAVRVGDVVYLGTTEAMNRRYPAGNGTTNARFSIVNGSTDEIVKSLNDALPKGTLVVGDKRTGTVVVTGSPMSVGRARTLITMLDGTSTTLDRVVPMRYVKAADALKALQSTLQMTAPSSAYASSQQNAIVLTGTNDFLRLATDLIERVDRPGQQVRYDVAVTDLTPTETSDIGFLFGGIDINGVPHAGSGSTVTTFLKSSIQVNATINALVTRGEAKILARPTLSSLNNVAASLLVGEQYPILYFDARTGNQEVQFVNVGVNLNVTPTIGTDGAITTELETDYSQIAGTISTFPIIATRKANRRYASTTARRSSSPASSTTSIK